MRLLTNFTKLAALGGLAPSLQLCPNTIDIAGGGLPNSNNQTSISPEAAKDFQLAIAFKNLQVSLFNTGFAYLAGWNTSGYPTSTLQALSTVDAQQQVHLATLASIANNSNTMLIAPCNYYFPINSTKDFFDLAHVITSISIGANIGIIERLAVTDPAFVQPALSMLTVEARHDTFLRSIGGKEPSPAPFDTGISNIWAYNLALSFVVPGSCPVEIPFPTLPKLTVNKLATSNMNTTGSLMQFEFTWDPNQAPFVAEPNKQLMIGWVNQLNTPRYTPMKITTPGHGIASVPRDMNGVAFAVVTVQQPDNIIDLTLATMAGPVVVLLS